LLLPESSFARAEIPRLSDPVKSDRSVPRWMAALLNDPRDAIFVRLALECGLVALVGIGLYFSGRYLWWCAPLYWALNSLWVMDRFILMLHCTSHRPLFRPAFSPLNWLIPWVLGPFFGQTPETYFVHHLGMHHREENGFDDASSTMPFQRDRLVDWLRYLIRFLVSGHLDLFRYLRRGSKTRLIRRFVIGELVFAGVMAVLLWHAPGPTFVVFLGPVLVARTLMMAGNWGQHAFVCPEQPTNPYRYSITCINSRYNRRCFNDGYHIYHHIRARSHWTEYPGEFQQNISTYGREDAIVFEGMDFFTVWLALMMGRWRRLARAFCRLPGAPPRSEDQVIALLRHRLTPFVPEVGDLSEPCPEPKMNRASAP
jgi:hypothetical protein